MRMTAWAAAEQWNRWSRCSMRRAKRGRKHADDLRSVVDAMIQIDQTG